MNELFGCVIRHSYCVSLPLCDLLNLQISFDTVGGYDAVKEELRRSVIAPFRRLIYQAESNKDASQPTKVAQVAKGALFWGPPGMSIYSIER